MKDYPRDNELEKAAKRGNVIEEKEEEKHGFLYLDNRSQQLQIIGGFAALLFHPALTSTVQL